MGTRCQQGLTLVELMAVLALAGILVSLGVPAMDQFRRSAERARILNDFLRTLHLARSEAIKRGAVISLCRSVNGATCANGERDWSRGWIAFLNADADQPAQRDRGEELLRAHGGWSHGIITSNRVTFTYRAILQFGSNGTIVFCDPEDPHGARAIIVSHAGRPRVSRRDASNKPLRCGGVSP